MARPRYRFAEFTVSPALRLLLRAGEAQPRIPRYFDLLLLLLERRDVAVRREEIFERVWGDVVVSDETMVRLLLAAGADPRARTRSGTTPLTNAVACGRTGNVRALIESAPDLRLTDSFGDSMALLMARLRGRGRGRAGIVELVSEPPRPR